ncbi:unnamed protein product [Rotaria sordida]|uniref:Uncharacterized protein n=1 Tax=Rotaria sordida TaxID=392033 RepID=A0A814Q3D2_9BILA|nr:unnamed protein product [Rotaria sordida]CAF1114181.1 unnamed protein product [Rotaria sordida]CAF3998059.1 unnamed protein product [Rotaria sordida]CAF4058039.1 unnamed protein product [Rotaria sordida]
MSSSQGSSPTAVDKAANDNKSNQCNPNNAESRGHESGYTGTGDKADLDNHANQLNSNNPNYQSSGSK